VGVSELRETLLEMKGHWVADLRPDSARGGIAPDLAASGIRITD
jgi:hypothetical protein